jgi:predicted ATPase
MFNLNLNNYRSFQNQDLKFSRVNILIGENNSGKSSLLKFLLALKQSFIKGDELNLTLIGEYTDLGKYSEAVYYQQVRKHISFSFEFEKDYFDFFLNFVLENEDIDTDVQIKREQNKILKILKNYYDSKIKITFTLNSKLNDHSSIKTIIEGEGIGRIEIIQQKETKFILDYGKANVNFEFEDEKGLIKDISFTKEAFLSLIHRDIREKCNELFPKKGEIIFYKIAFLLITQNYIRSISQKIRYVNPIKTSPNRFYFLEDKKASYKLIDIEKFVNIIGNKKSKERETRLALMNKFIKSFGIAEEIKLISDDKLPVLALEVKTKNLWSNITDVGYGISLQLPILFQAIMSEYYTKKGETLLIEQPEVHLHPNLQAKFIENLLSIGKKNTYFIETHSEHIIRKLQLLVKNKEFQLKPSDISIHYFKRGDNKFIVSSHEIGENGFLSPEFPSGFYDVSYNLVKEML